LGLAIVKRIIDEHGGIISVENTTGGALIRARLPLWRRTAPGKAAHAEPA